MGCSDHLLVCCHGLYGKPDHLQFVVDSFKKKFPDLIILNCESTSSELTLDGIDVCAIRVYKEIFAYLSKYSLSKISFLGYSLGGLIVRYVIGLLYEAKVFDKLTAMNFITMATPHLGVNSRAPFLAESILFRSGSQCTLYDSDYGPPLIWVLSEPSLPFFKGLRLFQQHLIVANSVGDRTVPFLSASLRKEDPYLTGLPAPVMDGGPTTIIKPSGIPYTKTTKERVAETMKVTAFYAVFIPILFTAWCIIAPVGFVQARNAKLRFQELDIDIQETIQRIQKLPIPSGWEEWSYEDYQHEIVTIFDTQLNLVRIDAHLGEYAHTHALIVVRNPGRHSYGAPVVEYVVEQFAL